MIPSAAKPILVVSKKTFFERYALELKEAHFITRMAQDPGLADTLEKEFDENRTAVEAVVAYLQRNGLAHATGTGQEDLVDGRYSLVVAVGGDGTLLAASHGVEKTPVVGVNSRPGFSVGYFCTADRANFRRVLDSILDGKEQPRELMRMDVKVNGVRMRPPALNDILFACINPAASTSYLLRCDNVEESQKSAGIWLATPAGSTAGIHAAGGRRMNLSELTMQYLVREPYSRPRQRLQLKRGYFLDGFSVTNLTPEAALYVDGSRIVHRLVYGDVIEPAVSEHPLRIYL